ncbi:DUF4153 domain-containing protein [Thalassococcus sp. BH17M4-6]|uniref:DUF4153 domain-containing protein n=1 Tax=Thalassococcus sp. BH17M4-6 TaxID=3413148 RepID=UPI003BD244FE
MPAARATPHDRALRPVLALIGALAGLAIWLFPEPVREWVPDPHVYLLLSTFAFGFFAMLLALVGPARATPALPFAGAVSLGVALLVWWASYRHSDVAAFLRLGYPVAAAGLILLVATPFAAAALRSRADWRHYPTLFELSWRILVRYASAVIFTALFWGLILLSDALLQLVRVGLLAMLQRHDAVPWLLTGAVFGLALAVVHEMRDYLSPYLVLRLLRLFVPVVLGVVAVFLLALPFSGLSDIVGSLSAAGTLLSVGLAAIVLVTVAIDRDPVEEVHDGWLRRSVQALALVIPLLAALALYAIAIRVGQYGWTPQRLIALSVALVELAYGLAYGIAILRGGPWARRIRAANVGMALLIVALSVLWLSPVLVPERIAARDQMARFADGVLPVADLPLRELGEDWGRPGRDVLEALRDTPEVAARIAETGVGTPTDDVVLTGDALRDALIEALPVSGGALTPQMLAELPDRDLQDWLRACRRTVPDGPGCFLALARFGDDAADLRGVLILNTGAGWVETRGLVQSGGLMRVDGFVVDLLGGTTSNLTPDVLGALHRGEGRIAPAGVSVLQVGPHGFYPEN